MFLSDARLGALLDLSSPSYGDLLTDAQSIQALVRDPSGLIQKVTVRSEWTPDIVLDYPLRPSAPGTKPSAVVRLLKPQVDLLLAPPFRPVTIAPAGTPGRKAAWAGLAAVAVGLLAIKGLVSLFKRR